jgi:hypothetical protein
LYSPAEQREQAVEVGRGQRRPRRLVREHGQHEAQQQPLHGLLRRRGALRGEERGEQPRGKRRRQRRALPAREEPGRGVALQVAFERQILKPVFHLIGYRLWVWKAIGYGSWVNLIQRAEPHRGKRRIFT